MRGRSSERPTPMRRPVGWTPDGHQWRTARRLGRWDADGRSLLPSSLPAFQRGATVAGYLRNGARCASRVATSVFRSRIRLRRALAPAMISTRLRGRRKTSANRRRQAALASPSTGRALTDTLRIPSRTPTISSRLAPGRTSTGKRRSAPRAWRFRFERPTGVLCGLGGEEILVELDGRSHPALEEYLLSLQAPQPSL